MNTYFLIAAILCFLLGLAHSILGEQLIFKHKRRKGKLVPTMGGSKLKEGHLRIIWASWHLASLFGWGIGALILKIALEQENINADFVSFFIGFISLAMFSSALLVLVGTKAKHPGWIVLTIIGILLWIGGLA